MNDVDSYINVSNIGIKYVYNRKRRIITRTVDDAEQMAIDMINKHLDT